LRNPFRNSFDRQTGGMFIGDVGQSVVTSLPFIPLCVEGFRDILFEIYLAKLGSVCFSCLSILATLSSDL
jgi:hypothetical protein